MSTDLYGIRVLEVAPEERRVKLRVFVVYYDTTYKSHQPLPEDLSFFLRILWDEGDTRFGEGGPIGDEIGLDEILDEAWVDQNAHRFVERLEQLETRNHPVDDYTAYDDFYYEGAGQWANEDKLVQADYDVWVSDKKWLEHLEEGMAWGTTSYETKAYVPAPDDGERVPDLGLVARSFAPFEAPTEAGTPDFATFSPDGAHLFVSSQAGEVVAYDAATLAQDAPEELWRQKSDILFATLGTSKEPAAVWLKHPYREGAGAWQMPTGAPVEFTPRARTASPEGTFWVNYGVSDGLDFVDEGGDVAWSIDTPNVVEACAFSADEHLVAMGGIFDSILLWDPQERRELGSIPVGDNVRSLAFSADARYLAAVVGMKSLVICRLEDTTEIRRLDAMDFLSSPTWSPDNRWLALAWSHGSTGYGGGVRLFEVAQP